MPRGNRYLVPGMTYHVTHRCHNRDFLLKFSKDRDLYRSMMRERLKAFDVSLLTYCITGNHVHLLLRASENEDHAISGFMQSLAGDFAQAYNIRKERSGAYWGDRYHATMVDSGEYLWSCMKYIDLNMVRAGVVTHPGEWAWTGYQELMGLRKRYRLLDVERLLELLGGRKADEFRKNYEVSIEESMARHECVREERWTESLAIGGEVFVKEVSSRIRNRIQVEVEKDSTHADSWVVRETRPAYG